MSIARCKIRLICTSANAGAGHTTVGNDLSVGNLCHTNESPSGKLRVTLSVQRCQMQDDPPDVKHLCSIEQAAAHDEILWNFSMRFAST